MVQPLGPGALPVSRALADLRRREVSKVRKVVAEGGSGGKGGDDGWG